MEPAEETPPLGLQIDKLQQLKAAKKQAEAAVKKVEADIASAEAKLLETLDAAGLRKASGTSATISVRESVLPQCQDWDAFYAFIRENNYFHLLERRPSSLGCREIFEMKGQIPGVVPFTKRVLSLTST